MRLGARQRVDAGRAAARLPALPSCTSVRRNDRLVRENVARRHAARLEPVPFRKAANERARGVTDADAPADVRTDSY
ncbi:hypothetical protein C6T71_11015 [Burkholderia multivorans]|nr:hypothetical protein C6T71_11015 [Burkholderia multivorans]